MSNEILRIGAFGTGNLGDDLMLQAILAQEPDAGVVAYGRPLISADIEYIQFETLMADANNILRQYKSVIFGGGDLFWSAKNISDMLVLTLLAKKLGLQVSLSRVGLHGFESNSAYVHILLNSIDAISVRDSFSVGYAKKFGRSDVLLEPDWVFDLVENIRTPRIEIKPIKIGINFSDIKMTGDDQGFINHISGVFSELSSRFKDVAEFYYIPFCVHRTFYPENDFAVGSTIWESSQGRISYLSNIRTTDDLLECVSSMDILVGRRFHMNVLGFAMNKSVIPMVEHPGEVSKYSAIAYDKGVNPVPYSRCSQAFLTKTLESRISEAIAKIRCALRDENE